MVLLLVKWFCAVFIVLICSLALYIYKQLSLASEVLYNPQRLPEKQYNHIVIIGDEHAQTTLSSLLEGELGRHNLYYSVSSYVQNGATSREVYENLFKDVNKLHSSGIVLRNRPEYGCILAGSNDLARQSGPLYYSHHLQLIIRALIKSGIKPVVIALPLTNAEERFAFDSLFQKFRCSLMAIINNKGRFNHSRDYCNRLYSDLYTTGLLYSVIYIQPEETDLRLPERLSHLMADAIAAHRGCESYQEIK